MSSKHVYTRHPSLIITMNQCQTNPSTVACTVLHRFSKCKVKARSYSPCLQPHSHQLCAPRPPAAWPCPAGCLDLAGTRVLALAITAVLATRLLLVRRDLLLQLHLAQDVVVEGEGGSPQEHHGEALDQRLKHSERVLPVACRPGAAHLLPQVLRQAARVQRVLGQHGVVAVQLNHVQHTQDHHAGVGELGEQQALLVGGRLG
mmetsp:Transcript_2479/g.6382  ORF Transcript_2479/g.6382 Transcript_2479/m.6382 type:complete len:203 (-) Transcript_2479:318-926(-)